MNRCDICQEEGINDCKNCKLGNPCYGCDDYDIENNSCKSKGACANIRGEKELKPVNCGAEMTR